MELDKEQAQLLTEIGYSAAVLGFADKADPIFDVLIDYMPENAAGSIGKAISKLSNGQFDEAVRILEGQAVNAKVSSEEARAIHLLALFLGGRRQEAEELVKEYVQGDGIVRSMAESLFATS